MAESFRDRIPPPYSIEETPSGYKVVSSNGILLCYIYTFDDRLVPGHLDQKLTHAEGLALAKRIAALGNEPD